MKNLKTKLMFLLFVIAVQSYSQRSNTTLQYYLEIPNQNNIPTITKNDDGTLKLNYKNSILTNLFQNYTINKFELAFPGGLSPILKIVYIIECHPNLILEINSNYSGYFGRNEKIEPIQLLYIPNDLGGTTGNPSMAQPELTFTNAPHAWDISTGIGVKVGNAEGALTNHEDLVTKITNLTSTGNHVHGTQVALVAAGATNNGVGIASTGFDCGIVTSYNGYSGLIQIANAGARVINMSWGGCNKLPLETQYGQTIMDQVWNSGVVLVAAAGNGAYSCSSYGRGEYHYPASLNHVISVTGVGHIYEPYDTALNHGCQKDIFELTDFQLPPGQNFSGTYNDKVDLSAPWYSILTASNNLVDGQYSYNGGTSFAAPMVAGAIGLMFGANSCLFPNEIESILKLTAFKNDTLPLNLPFQGGLGAGRLDSYKAVDMAKDMELPFGTVEVKDRIIDRWDFNLRTAPYEIKMTNNTLSGIATIDFTARDNIELINDGDYAPVGTGFMDLKINAINTVCNTPTYIQTTSQNVNNEIESNNFINPTKLYPNPNNGTFKIDLNRVDLKEVSVEVYDLFGKTVYKTTSNETTINVDIPNLQNGMYIIKLSNNDYSEVLKFVKE